MKDKYQEEKEERSTYNASYHAENRVRDNARMAEYARTHRQQINAQRAARRLTDEEYMVECRARDRLNAFVKKGNDKSGETFALIGCSSSDLRDHLRRQLPAPSTSLRGYDIDHIFPFAMFGSGDLNKVMHYSNMQPLTPEGNNDKRSKLPTQAMASKVAPHCWPTDVSMEDLPLQYDGWKTSTEM